MIRDHEAILAEVILLLDEGECTLEYDSEAEEYTLKCDQSNLVIPTSIER